MNNFDEEVLSAKVKDLAPVDREIMAETGLSKASGYRALGS